MLQHKINQINFLSRHFKLMYQTIKNYNNHNHYKMTANRNSPTFGTSPTTSQIPNMTSQRIVTSCATVRSMRLRMKDTLDLTENGRKLKHHIMNDMTLDEFLPFMMEGFPRNEYHKLTHLRDTRGENKAMEGLLEAVFRYDGGLVRFYEALGKTGHRNTKEYYKHLLKKCNEEYKKDVIKLEQDKRKEEERRLKAETRRRNRRSRSEESQNGGIPVLDTNPTVRSDPDVNSIVEISLGNRSNNNERSNNQSNINRHQPDFRTRNNRVFFD